MASKFDNVLDAARVALEELTTLAEGDDDAHFSAKIVDEHTLHIDYFYADASAGVCLYLPDCDENVDGWLRDACKSLEQAAHAACLW